MSELLNIDKLRSRRVLIVDDNPGDRLLYKHYLEESDPTTEYQFIEADSGRKAMELVRQGNLDCILLDYLLPDTVGLGLLKVWGGHDTGAVPPVIMLTGFGDEAIAVNALQSGAQGYISKRDLNGETLKQTMDRSIKEHREEQLKEKHRRDLAGKNEDLEGKFRQMESFYRQVLGKLKKPVLAMRDQIAEMANPESIQGPGELRTQLKHLCVESERLVMTLKNLTDNPGIDVGQLLISTRPESLMELVSSTVTTFRSAAHLGQVKLVVKLHPGLPDVEIDRFRIEQVLSNLLDNAIRFTPPQGKIVLKADCLLDSPQFVTVSVIDTGAGIHPESMANLLNGKSASNSQDAAAGTAMGLGLKVCKEIIRSHRGEISITALPQGGTCATFTLPIEANRKPQAKMWEGARSGDASLWRIHA